MNADIRIQTTFRESHKRKKLQRILGTEGVLALIDLWVGVAVSKPCGELQGWDIDDIALEANYPGSADEFVDALLSVGFLEKNDDGVFFLHNWSKNQPWAANQEQRSLSAKKNQLKRWCCKEFSEKKGRELFIEWYKTLEFVDGYNTKTILSLYGSYTERNTPLPLPLPLPKDVTPKDLPLSVIIFSKEFYKYLSGNGGKKKYTEKETTDGAATIDKLIRLDKYSLEDEIKPALRWGLKDDFWSGQIRSLAPLRKKSNNGDSKFTNMFNSFSSQKTKEKEARF